ncbi:CRAL-TRIO domain-containing protein [Pholiota molesta]|nr:CRAL-TRIO domain-containing protein [Pholiota molesta]
MAAATDKTFLALPPPPTTYDDDPRANISAEEQKMYDEVLAHFTKTDPVYTIPQAEKDAELMDEEKFWLSRDCLLRYLRASKWKVNAAIQRLEATLKWRREFGMYDKLDADLVEPEAVTGKEILFGYDKLGKPAFYMIPSRQNTTEATRQIQFAVWMLERGIDLMEPGVENLALLINFGDRGKNPSMSTALAVLNILQNHYPERLGLALIINVPFLINAFFKVVMPLVDPITRNKVKFNPEIFKDGLFTTDNVMKEWGGDHHFEYDHDKYWPDLVTRCQSRTKNWEKNWRELGATVGISEWAYKTHTDSDASTVDEKAESVVSKGPEISIQRK